MNIKHYNRDRRGKLCCLFLGITMSIVAAVVPQRVFGADAEQFQTPMDKVFYSVGVELVRNLKNQGVVVDPDKIMAGMRDALAGDVKLNDKELRKVVIGFQSELRQKHALASKLAARENSKPSDVFMAENGKKEGVVTLPDGLQYKVITVGKGMTPNESSLVEYHYRGTLISGKEVLNTRESGRPVTGKPVDEHVPGIREALLRMSVGSKYQLFVPPHLAYGERGFTGVVGPNEILLIEIELLSVK